MQSHLLSRPQGVDGNERRKARAGLDRDKGRAGSAYTVAAHCRATQ